MKSSARMDELGAMRRSVKGDVVGERSKEKGGGRGGAGLVDFVI